MELDFPNYKGKKLENIFQKLEKQIRN